MIYPQPEPGMTFDQACSHARSGGKSKRRGWSDDKYVHYDYDQESFFLTQPGGSKPYTTPYGLTHADKEANDWMAI